jgi:hypothetical protein
MLPLILISLILLLGIWCLHIFQQDNWYYPAHLQLCTVYSKCSSYNHNSHQPRNSSQHGYQKYERLELEIFHWELDER